MRGWAFSFLLIRKKWIHGSNPRVLTLSLSLSLCSLLSSLAPLLRGRIALCLLACSACCIIAGMFDSEYALCVMHIARLEVSLQSCTCNAFHLLKSRTLFALYKRRQWMCGCCHCWFVVLFCAYCRSHLNSCTSGNVDVLFEGRNDDETETATSIYTC